ncbi:beta-glucosidase G [Apiospora hydei]|uniref:Probable beta-glucosidase G n=1 Tax=Apiospora hydei TaxID=1337664 RepID=A0ABR1WS10_9PEZI
MASPRILLLSALAAIAPAANAQNFGGGSRGADDFTYVQPLNTTILSAYGHSPAVYPSPKISGNGGWKDAMAKAQDFVSQLTPEEKADMVTGAAGPCVGNIKRIERLGFNGLCLQDGPLSIRVADYASVFSAGVSAAASWDRKILYERGFAMGEEFKAKGAHVALSPVCGPLGRSAYSGRNWEGFAADPYLTGVAMEETIKGHQDAGVQATPKHFIGNEQETQRNPNFDETGTNVIQEAVSSNIDDRTMHELYLWPFANSVRAKAASIMCSYQRINGSYGCENSKTLNGLLKGELGFQGYVMSDWGAVHSGVASIESGLDMNMPGGLGSYGMDPTLGSFFGGNVTTAVNNGTLDATRLDDMIVRIMTPYYLLGQDKDFPTTDASSGALNTFFKKKDWKAEDWNMTGETSRDVRGNHGDLIRKHGAEATVLLKNAPKSIAVFGNDAGDITEGFLNQKDYEFGTLAAVKARAKKDGAIVCIVFLKTWAEEGADRKHLSVDWDGEEVVASVAKDCPNTVVVTHSSGINVLPFADHPNVTAIVAAHYPGQESGNSIADILYGDVNPSGHLPYTIAFNGTDYNAPPTTQVNTTGIDDWQSWFDEKLEIDYRYFDAHNISVRYEFGFGLSYTTFELADVKVETLDQAITATPKDEPIQPGGNPALWAPLYNVTVEVSNTGDVDGAAVPQLYVNFPASTTPAGTPPQQLRGFDKVMLKKGEKTTVSFELMRRDLSYWDVVSQGWVIPAGEFTLSAGLSSRDFKAQAKVTPIKA